MERTTNLNLPQWEASDPIRRGDFNEAMAAIDAMAAGSCRIAWGSYTGNVTYGADNPNHLEFSFKPLIVILGCDLKVTSATNPAVLIRGRTKAASDGAVTTEATAIMQLTWTETGVSWYAEKNATFQSNLSTPYYYVALGVSA